MKENTSKGVNKKQQNENSLADKAVVHCQGADQAVLDFVIAASGKVRVVGFVLALRVDFFVRAGVDAFYKRRVSEVS